jgi:hypothetical protein
MMRHGKSKSRVYAVWWGMLARCNSPSNPAYKNYGGRGIRVCERWHTFESFYADMGDPPQGLTLERRENAEGYSPSNCEWASRKDQSRNRRSLHLVTIGSETLPLSEWIERIGAVSYATAHQRITLGWAAEEAIRTPKVTKRKGIPRGQKIAGNSEPRVGLLSLSEAIEKSGLAYGMVTQRLKRGWSVAEALSCPPRKGRRENGVAFNEPKARAA